MMRGIHTIYFALIILIVALSLSIKPVNAQYADYAGYGLYGGGLYGGGLYGSGLYGGGLYGGGLYGWGLYGALFGGVGSPASMWEDGWIWTGAGFAPVKGSPIDTSRYIWIDDTHGYDPITGAMLIS